MHDTQEQIETVELTLKEARDSVQLKNALLRLDTNADYKLLVLHGYFEVEAARLVMSKAAPAMATEEHQAMINKSIDAVGAYFQYTNTVYHKGMVAEKAIISDEETRDELLAEGGE